MKTSHRPQLFAPGLVFMTLLASVAAPVGAAIDFIHVDGFEDQADCATPLACPLPPSGKSCVSGQLMAAGSGAPLRAFIGAGLACGGGAVGGPCDLKLTVNDAVVFAQDPNSAMPLPVAETIVDGCGRFRLAGITPPAFGFVAIVTDDADPAVESNFHAPAATPRALGANVRIDNLEVIAARNDTIAHWTQTAGSPFGASGFLEQGTILAQFSVAGSPRPGVTLTLNGNTSVNNDYYFSDLAPPERHTVDAALTNTGPNGAALVVGGGGFVGYSGTGAEPPACTWPTMQAAAIPGVLTYIQFDC